MLLATCGYAHAVILPATSYQQHFFAEPDSHAAIQKSGNLAGVGWGMAGWVEYQITVEETGWYQLLSHGAAPGGVEFEIDADEVPQGARRQYYYRKDYRAGSSFRIGNAWLTAGMHRIRLTRYFWTGFPKITAIELRRSRGDLASSLRVQLSSDERIFRVGQCPKLIVSGGGDHAAGTLEVLDSSADASRTDGRYSVTFASSGMPVTRNLALPCKVAGIHRLAFRVNGQTVPADALPTLNFQIVDTHRNPPARTAEAERGPLVDIDCTKQMPDYASASGTRLRTLPDLRYRESGAAVGWIPYQRSSATDRSSRPEPDWFAYRIAGVLPQQRYRVDIDYPDDSFRSFAVAWRESAPATYPAATAVETGREYRVSSAARTMTFHVWALATGPRLVFMAPHDGDRAACLRIRVTLEESPRAPAADSRPGYRQFINWYEEGENFTGFFGARNDDMEAMSLASARWLEEAASRGVSTVMPTAVIYNFAMYPSRFNRAFSEPERDTLRLLVLQAERLGLKIIPELHPRADELAYSRDDVRSLRNLAVSRGGRNNFSGESGRNTPPYFNALDPANQEWYVGMIRELAERYRDSPAFQGISLRYMTWANAALDNLVDLDWGYDDFSIGLYRAETASQVPVGDLNDTQRFQRRHAWLLANEKAAWIRWRCNKLTTLFTRLQDTLSRVRPDLQLHLHLFGPALAAAAPGATPAGDEFLSRLREAGLDIPALAKINGLVIVNSTFQYGRGEQDGVVFAAARDALLNPGAMGAFPHGPVGQWYVPTSRYLEATSDIVPPQKLGLPASTKATWMSAASNPPGRQVLERYAILLAETDALSMGDGGNNQTLGPTEVAGFMSEYRKLPQLPFEQVADAQDPVTVRALQQEDGYIFYAVNRESYRIRLTVELSGVGRLEQDGRSQLVNATNRRLDLDLQPYELRAVNADPAIRIVSVVVEVPAAERNRILARINWVDNLLAGSASVKPVGEDARILRQASSVARDAFNRGWLWRAHVALEMSPVLQALRRTGCSPPDLVGSVPNYARCAALADR